MKVFVLLVVLGFLLIPCSFWEYSILVQEVWFLVALLFCAALGIAKLIEFLKS